jgi:hypothetical protein
LLWIEKEAQHYVVVLDISSHFLKLTPAKAAEGAQHATGRKNTTKGACPKCREGFTWKTV